MKTLIGGAIATALGLIGIVVWWIPFLQLLAGAIPAMLLLGGGLALYLGFDEMKDSMKGDSGEVVGEDLEQAKQEIDDLKKELETLKTDKPAGE
ncbi:MAG: hypothetical protein K9L30_06090 [Desulfobacterales bacterium]|nr:hypothetical protein [Desulfobacterales bacterium]